MADRPGDDTGLSDEDILAGAGFCSAAEVTIAASPLRYRDEDEIVASVFSLSYAAPGHFGSRRAEFERDLRALLRRASPDGQFCEQPTRHQGPCVAPSAVTEVATPGARSWRSTRLVTACGSLRSSG